LRSVAVRPERRTVCRNGEEIRKRRRRLCLCVFF
jgi:hypothetical protein